jgi:hypothetical protein
MTQDNLIGITTKKNCDFLARTITQKNNQEQMYSDGIFQGFLSVWFCCSAAFADAQIQKDLTTLDYLLSKISSKIDTFHLDQQPTTDLTMAPHHRSLLEPPDLQVKAALMEAEVEAVTDGDGNRGSGGGGNSDSDSGGGRQQQGQETINNMRWRLAAVGSGWRRWRRRWGEAAVKGGGQR